MLSCLLRRVIISQYYCKNITTFGFESVSEQEKASKVQQVFSNVASNYDIMNDVMSFGLHRCWKDYFVYKLSPSPGTRVVDVAGGTGDIGHRIVNYKDERTEGEPVTVTIVDANNDMLQEGKRKYNDTNITWVHGDALSLPFAESSFDAYTIAFGIRNVANFNEALGEAYRVLRPGGRFLCMEFSQVHNTLLKSLYELYSFQLIPIFGELIAQDRQSYQYLVESIKQFPNQDDFATMVISTGFCHVNYESLLNGIIAIHSGFKPQTVQ